MGVKPTPFALSLSKGPLLRHQPPLLPKAHPRQRPTLAHD